jgi:hypothetical protein
MFQERQNDSKDYQYDFQNAKAKIFHREDAENTGKTFLLKIDESKAIPEGSISPKPKVSLASWRLCVGFGVSLEV